MLNRNGKIGNIMTTLQIIYLVVIFAAVLWWRCWFCGNSDRTRYAIDLEQINGTDAIMPAEAPACPLGFNRIIKLNGPIARLITFELENSALRIR